MPASPPYPSPTWPDGATPTVDQLKEWVRTHRPDQGYDARVAADMIVGMLADEQRRRQELQVQVEAVDLVLAELSDDTRAEFYEAVRAARAKRGQS